MRYSLPYGKSNVVFEAPEEQIIFTGEMRAIPKLNDIEAALIQAMDNPIGAKPLRLLAKGKKNIVFLVEDGTRDTPLSIMMPVITDYLNRHGIPDDAMSFLTAPGTHRIMTEGEIIEKLGGDMVRRFAVRQHDANIASDMRDLGTVNAGDYEIPVHVNKYALGSDLLIGLGNIVPHSDAGLSGGAKILQPGVCDFGTTAATHAAAGFCPDIPLGMVEGNPCRRGMEEVAKRANLAFIINVVKNYNNKVAGIFAGDFLTAHREGVKLARESFKVSLPELADIVIVSSSPADLDYWQAEKGVTSAYFAVKKGGIIIFVSPCFEGLAHNHPHFREWLSLPLEETLKRLRNASPFDTSVDIISAVLAVCNSRVRNKASIFSVSEGLLPEDIEAMQYTPFPNIEEALNEALRRIPQATIGILPKGGISLPMLEG